MDIVVDAAHGEVLPGRGDDEDGRLCVLHIQSEHGALNLRKQRKSLLVVLFFLRNGAHIHPAHLTCTCVKQHIWKKGKSKKKNNPTKIHFKGDWTYSLSTTLQKKKKRFFTLCGAYCLSCRTFCIASWWWMLNKAHRAVK